VVFHSFQRPILQDPLRNIQSTVSINLRAILQEIYEFPAFGGCHITYANQRGTQVTRYWWTDHQDLLHPPTYHKQPPSPTLQCSKLQDLYRPLRINLALGVRYSIALSDVRSPMRWSSLMTKQSPLAAHQQISPATTGHAFTPHLSWRNSIGANEDYFLHLSSAACFAFPGGRSRTLGYGLQACQYCRRPVLLRCSRV
jgi:hypothetical protein